VCVYFVFSAVCLKDVVFCNLSIFFCVFGYVFICVL